MTDYVEIARFYHLEPMEACVEVLTEAGIPTRVDNDSLTTNLSIIQPGAVSSAMVLVPSEQESPARMALLEGARREVAEEIDPMYPLVSSTEEELRALLNKPWENSAYDLALAEKLLRDRGLSPGEITFTREIPAKDGGEEKILNGRRRVSALLILYGVFVLLLSMLKLWGMFEDLYHEYFGAFAGIMGGFLLGGAVAWNVAFATERRSDGLKYYVFGEGSRKCGKIMLLGSLLALVGQLIYLIWQSWLFWDGD